jgi:hypothetical protein
MFVFIGFMAALMAWAPGANAQTYVVVAATWTGVSWNPDLIAPPPTVINPPLPPPNKFPKQLSLNPSYSGIATGGFSDFAQSPSSSQASVDMTLKEGPTFVNFGADNISLSQQGGDPGQGVPDVFEADSFAELEFPNGLPPSQLTLGAPTVSGNVGVDQGDYDAVREVLLVSISNQGQPPTNLGPLEIGPWVDQTPGDVFGPLDLSQSMSLPEIQPGQVLMMTDQLVLTVFNYGDAANINGSFDVDALPEPASTSLLLGAGLLLMRRIGSGRARQRFQVPSR